MTRMPDGNSSQQASNAPSSRLTPSGPGRGFLMGAREWWAFGVSLLGLAAVLALVVLGDPPFWATISRVVGVLAVGVLLWAVMGMPRTVQVVWWCLWLFQALTVVADLLYDALLYYVGTDPFPSIADVLYLAGYVPLVIALVLLVHRQRPDRNRQTWIDTAIVIIAATCIVATVVIVPMTADLAAEGPSAFVALAYPFMDLVALSVLLRLLVGVDNWNPALALLTMSVIAALIADLAFNGLAAQGATADGTPPWLEVIFLAGVVLLTIAAIAPGARTITAPSTDTHRTKGRILGLALGALTAPTLLVFSIWDDVGSAARLLALASIVVILLVLWGALILMNKVQQQAALLSDLARTDGLTGLANRRTWDFELERVAASTSARKVPLTVAMMDLDHFKDFNDLHGHPAGDRMLVACANAWQAALNPDALLARYGGEEFAVLLPDVGPDQAEPILESLRRATPNDVTVSIGYAQRQGDEPPHRTLGRADQALYRAKSTGRDRVVADLGSDSRAAP